LLDPFEQWHVFGGLNGKIRRKGFRARSTGQRGDARASIAWLEARHRVVSGAHRRF
jgi:hypothetical protein